MAREPCEACGRGVSIAGGIAEIWTFSHQPSGGMTLEFDDGSEAFLCFDCIERLPADPTAADVDAIADDGRDGG